MLAGKIADLVTPSTVIVCIGNELVADDGAGVEAARMLAGNVPWQVYNAQTVPESFVVKIADRKPDSVLLIDALDFGAEPGRVTVLDADELGGQSPSTHGPAPIPFVKLLKMMCPCRCFVLGIQPRNGTFGEPISEEVREAVSTVAAALRLLGRRPHPAAGGESES